MSTLYCIARLVQSLTVSCCTLLYLTGSIYVAVKYLTGVIYFAVVYFAGVSYLESVNVTDDDYAGPLPSVPTEGTDYLLIFSWVFNIAFCIVMFVRSRWGKALFAHLETLFGHTERVHIE